MSLLTSDFLNNRENRGRLKRFLMPGLAVFLLAGLLAAGGFYLFKNQDEKVPETAGNQLLPESWVFKYFGVSDENDPKVGGPGGDADGDILTNHQEYLFGTDPTSEDTDGDGESDGVEVAFGRNPTGQGVWKLTPQARDFVTSLINSREDLRDFSQEKILAEVQQLFQPDRTVVLDLPDASGFSLTNANTPQAFETYFNNTEALMSADEQEIQNVAGRLFSTMSTEEIDFQLKKLQATEKLLLNMPVPSELKEIHRYKIAGLRAGIRMFELARDNYTPGTPNNQFWADVFYQLTAAQEAGVVELALWREIGQVMRDTGGLSQLEE